ncbi:aminotransferase class V-fold PLP-dependent enzyme, partial [Candidatus Woesearchaeota archaeon]|nr:aminotransferase class V-fold PLP-dependent enzyme [Candidatus Woesearchaeota archaeon]
MKSEEELRKEILDRVREIYSLRKSQEVFVPGKSKVHYAGRVFDEKEMVAVVDSALEFWLTLGKKGVEFQKRFADYLGMPHCVVVNSGSSANLIAVGALCSRNIKNPMKPGDEVITTAMTFPTTLAPILQNGLVPVFVDVELGTYNIDASLIEDAITDKTRAIFFAHTLGNPAEIDKIMKIAKKHNLYVIEDTCDALDSLYDGKLVGTFGDISTYSFYA